VLAALDLRASEYAPLDRAVAHEDGGDGVEQRGQPVKTERGEETGVVGLGSRRRHAPDYTDV
jgi:hypothetical protein